MNKIIRIIVVDDHPSIRFGIKFILKPVKDIEVVAEAESGMQLFKILKKVVPNVILLDLNMKNLSGYDITKILKVEYPSIKIIIFSFHQEQDCILNSLNLGADGFITKDSKKAEIIAGIRTVSKKNEMFICKEARKKICLNLEVFEELTKREYEVLKLISLQKSSTEIACELKVSLKTVEAHRTSLMKKTNSKNNVGLGIYAKSVYF